MRDDRYIAYESDPSIHARGDARFGVIVISRGDDELRVERLMWEHAVLTRDIQSVTELLRPGWRTSMGFQAEMLG
ncbi:MAG: hypothetical protein ABIR27_00590 [Dokdonella sp.]